MPDWMLFILGIPGWLWSKFRELFCHLSGCPAAWAGTPELTEECATLKESCTALQERTAVLEKKVAYYEDWVRIEQSYEKKRGPKGHLYLQKQEGHMTLYGCLHCIRARRGEFYLQHSDVIAGDYQCPECQQFYLIERQERARQDYDLPRNPWNNPYAPQ